MEVCLLPVGRKIQDGREFFFVWLVKTQYLRLFCKYLDKIKCNVNRNACCRKLLSYLIAWMAKRVRNPHESHDNLDEMFWTKVHCIYLHYTDCHSYWVNVHQNAEGSMCPCRNAPDTSQPKEVSTALPAGVCLLATLQLTHAFFLPSNFTILCTCALFFWHCLKFSLCCCLFPGRKSCY